MDVFKKVLYTILLLVILPAMLYGWMVMTNYVIQINVPDSDLLAVLFALPGLLIMLIGLTNLFLTPDRLPVNNHPGPGPTAWVFDFVPYPVHLGFALACIGISIFLRSSGGLWLISPVVALSCVALVYGYERPAIQVRFGASRVHRLIALASAEKRRPFLHERMSAYVLVLIPWLVAYEAVAAIGIVPDAINNYLPFENSWPVLEWTTVFYFGTYVFVPLVPFIARQAVVLRQFSIAGIWAIALTTVIFIVIPFVAPPRPFVPETTMGRLLEWERTYDTAMCAFPSFHAMWALLTAWLYAKSFPRLTALWWAIGLLICLSCVTTGMHSLVDVVGGMSMVPLVLNIGLLRNKLTALLVQLTQGSRIIGSTFGLVVGIFLLGIISGNQSVKSVIFPCTVIIVGAAWKQPAEGSPGFYEQLVAYFALAAGFLICSLATLFDEDFWRLMSAFSIASHIMLASRRLSSLIHGSTEQQHITIAFILWHLFVTVILIRICTVGTPFPMIVGLNLVLIALGNFLQTGIAHATTLLPPGRSFLQGTAIACVILGVLVTTIQSGSTAQEKDSSGLSRAFICNGHHVYPCAASPY